MAWARLAITLVIVEILENGKEESCRGGLALQVGCIEFLVEGVD
jgi:hypothetical protein